MMQIDFAAILRDAIGLVVAGIAGLVARAIKKTHTRIETLENCTVRKKDFERLEEIVQNNLVRKEEFREAQERAEKQRDELRESVLKLFDKLDEIKTILIQKNTGGRA